MTPADHLAAILEQTAQGDPEGLVLAIHAMPVGSVAVVCAMLATIIGNLADEVGVDPRRFGETVTL